MSKKTQEPVTIEDFDMDEARIDELADQIHNGDVAITVPEDDDFGDIAVEVAGMPPRSSDSFAVMELDDFIDGIQDVDSDSEEFVKALFYGPNGTGKTTVAGTFPGPVLVLDINERGTRALVGLEKLTGMKARKRFVDAFELFVMGYWYLKLKKHPYKTVVLDNVTTLQELAMKFVMGKEASVDLSKDMDMPTKRDWGGLSQLMKRWLIDFRNLPMNVVFIAQEKSINSDDVDLDSDEVTVFPQISKSAAAILGAAVDVIGRTYTKEVTVEGSNIPETRFMMRVAPNSKYQAKIRTPIGVKPPRSIKNPSYDKLVKIMKGEVK